MNQLAEDAELQSLAENAQQLKYLPERKVSESEHKVSDYMGIVEDKGFEAQTSPFGSSHSFGPNPSSHVGSSSRGALEAPLSEEEAWELRTLLNLAGVAEHEAALTLQVDRRRALLEALRRQRDHMEVTSYSTTNMSSEKEGGVVGEDEFWRYQYEMEVEKQQGPRTEDE